MTKKLFLLSAVMWLCGTTLMATSVSRQKAQEIAAHFISQKSPTHRALSVESMQTEVVFNQVNGMGVPYLYVVKVSEGKGYVLVSGDDRFAEVLGYSDSGPSNQ